MKFKFNQIKNKDPYTLILDCDEFIYSFNKDLNLSKLIDKKKCINIRWLMNPLTKSQSFKNGFLGTGCKQIACSKSIIEIKSCHKFRIEKKFFIDEASRFGLFLIHNWSRSLFDCLLKTTFSKIKNIKTIDQLQIKENLKMGRLFSRAKYLAFLDIQTRYITGINDNYIFDFDKKKELELISIEYSESLLRLYFDLYEEYKIKLLKSSNPLENYPPFEGNILAQMRRITS